ncbi:hypothetical protein PCANC_15834 [Puccinia coronata f. sp. avenae]|uniref:Uncharacterized protein n=1 Tax=Puccinia coronata f. sp. avenae TaxID=200324 RepID=A0A2N5SQR4_9BASI|nr:hypothetical protein PCANC_15834 [Puccinia coronata f. sp. avenae]
MQPFAYEWSLHSQLVGILNGHPATRSVGKRKLGRISEKMPIHSLFFNQAVIMPEDEARRTTYPEEKSSSHFFCSLNLTGSGKEYNAELFVKQDRGSVLRGLMVHD